MCVRDPACVAFVLDATYDPTIGWNYCWILKSAAKPAVYNMDKSFYVIADRATATDEGGKTPGERRIGFRV